MSGAAERIGKKRCDLPWIENELEEEFKQAIINFPNIKLPQTYELLEKYRKNKNIIIFKTRDEADIYLEKLCKNTSQK